MAWIESHQKLKDDPKVFDVAVVLNCSKAEAIGRLHMLWWWCVDHAPTGDLSLLNDGHLAMAVELNPSEGPKFKEALIKAGFLERKPYFRISNWWKFIGRFMKQRFKDDPAKWREIENRYTVTATVTGQDTVAVTAADTVTQEERLPLPKRPNLTVQNSTERESVPPARASERRPKDLEECLAVAGMIGLTEAEAREWFNDCEVVGWKRGDGTPFDVWRRQLTLHRDRLRGQVGRGNGSVALLLGSPVNGNKPPTVYQLKTQVEALDGQIQEVERKGYEDAFGLHFSNPDDRTEWAKMKKRRKELRKAIAEA